MQPSTVPGPGLHNATALPPRCGLASRPLGGGLVAVAIQTTADLHLLASCTGDGRQKAALVNERILRQDFEMCLHLPPSLEMQSRLSVHSFIAPRSNQALILTPLSGQLPPADGAHYRRIGTPVFVLRDCLCEPCELHTSLSVPGNDNRSASMCQKCYRGITLAPLPGRDTEEWATQL